jgi:hypothetical protein
MRVKDLNPRNFATDDVVDQNLAILAERLSQLEVHCLRVFKITSGLRDMADHQRIYAALNAKNRVEGKPEVKVPIASKHLYGQAADVSDHDGSLYDWCVTNEAILAKVGLWLEVKDSEKRVHFQIVPPKSGNRFFYA